MTEFSCFYIHYNRNPVNFTFIKYEKFMKIMLQDRTIVIEFQNLKNYKILFDFYILSLLCTENTSKIDYMYDEMDETIIYGISTEKIWKYLYFYGKYDNIILEKKRCKNPLLSKEPKKETSLRKIKKVIKMIDNYYITGHIKDPLTTIKLYQENLLEITAMNKIIEYEKRIYLLCCIKNFNNDIYMNIKRFM